MEFRSALYPPKLNKTQTELNEAARFAPIHTFGWPLGVYLQHEDARPSPTVDGIVARIKSQGDHAFDYWALRRNGDFFCAATLFEDQRREGVIFFNTRIVRVTEALLYLARLYGALGVDPTSRVTIAVRHAGLRGRVLSASNPGRSIDPRRISEDEVEAELTTTIGDLEVNLVSHVKSLVAPLFRLFEFLELGDPVYEDLVNKFVNGNVD